MGHYINETYVMLLGQAAERGDDKHVLDYHGAAGLFEELEWVRGLAYAAGVPIEKLGITEEHAWRLAQEAMK